MVSSLVMAGLFSVASELVVVSGLTTMGNQRGMPIPAHALLYPFICPNTGTFVTPRPRADPIRK
jgi:hypothetical protein